MSEEKAFKDVLQTVEEAKAEALAKPQPREFPMKMSESIGQLMGALSKAQGAMSNGAKDKQGFGYKYMELGVLIDIIRPHLATNEITATQWNELVKGDKPSVVTHTMLAHSSGEYMITAIELPIKVMSNLSQAQMIGVNCTYGRRYALQAAFLIASEEDTDASTKTK